MNKKVKKYITTVLIDHCDHHKKLREDKDNAYFKKDFYTYNKIKAILKEEKDSNIGCPNCQYCSYRSVDYNRMIPFHNMVCNKFPNFKYWSVYEKKSDGSKGKCIATFSRRNPPSSTII